LRILLDVIFGLCVLNSVIVPIVLVTLQAAMRCMLPQSGASVWDTYAQSYKSATWWFWLCHHQITPEGKIGRDPGIGELPKFWHF